MTVYCPLDLDQEDKRRFSSSGGRLSGCSELYLVGDRRLLRGVDDENEGAFSGDSGGLSLRSFCREFLLFLPLVGESSLYFSGDLESDREDAEEAEGRLLESWVDFFLEKMFDSTI